MFIQRFLQIQKMHQLIFKWQRKQYEHLVVKLRTNTAAEKEPRKKITSKVTLDEVGPAFVKSRRSKPAIFSGVWRLIDQRRSFWPSSYEIWKNLEFITNAQPHYTYMCWKTCKMKGVNVKLPAINIYCNGYNIYQHCRSAGLLVSCRVESLTIVTNYKL